MADAPSIRPARLRLPGGAALGSVLAAVLIGAIDLTVISTVLPDIVFDLRINTADIDRYIWVVNAYLIAYIVAIPVVGRLSDVLGRGAAFQAALAVFLAGSLWAGFADSLGQLVAARAVQGAGGGALLPITMALVGDLLPEGRRAATLGLVGAVDTLGWVLGPTWGAAIVALLNHESGSWRWVFWINVPVGLAIGLLVRAKVGGRVRAERGGPVRLDVAGALLLAAALTLLNLGLSSGGEAGIRTGSSARALGGTSNPLAAYLLPLLAGAAILLAAFVWWQRRAAHPLLPPALFRGRAFTAALAANFVAGAALIVAMVDVPITVALLEPPERISTVSALLLAPFTLLMAVAALAGGLVVNRLGERGTAILGVVLVAAGYAALWLGLRDTDHWRMLPGLALAGAGFGFVIAPIGATALDHAPEHDRGVAAASTILFRLLGMTLSISAFTAFGVRRLQSLSEAVPPVVRKPEETTAEFFLRQSQYIQEVAIPLTLKVVRETFLLAGLLAIVAVIPILALRGRDRS